MRPPRGYDGTRAVDLNALASQTAPKKRIRFLDVLRGIAILGILPVNAAYFAYPTYIADDARFPGAPGDATVTFLVQALAELKFITIFSFLFGVGMGLVAERAIRREAPYGVPMVRRLAALLLLGAMHGILLWPGDIVTHYAILGLASFWIARVVTPGALLWLGGAALAFSMLLYVPAAAMDEAIKLPDGEVPGNPLGTFREFAQNIATRDPDFELTVFGEGSWTRITALRAFIYLMILVFSLFLWSARTVGLFLIGMACVRMDWFRDPSSSSGRRAFRRMLAVGALVGVPFSFAAAYLTQGETDAASRVGGQALHYLGSLAFSGGIVAAVALLVSRFGEARWTRPFEAVGRTAFSCYIGQSVIMSSLFYAYGGGLFGRVDRTTLMAIVLAVWVLQLIVAPLWLTRFHAGPLEWLWRSVTYWKWQPFVRSRTA